MKTNLGNYDETEWRFFEPKPGLSPAEFPEYEDIDSIKPGVAYWLTTAEQSPLLDTGSGLSVPTNVPFKMPLMPGWNYIGNPFTFPIPFTPQNFYTANQSSALDVRYYSGTAWVQPQSQDEFDPTYGYAVSNNFFHH